MRFFRLRSSSKQGMPNINFPAVAFEIRFNVANITGKAGGTQQITATIFDQYGAASAGTIVWTTGNGAIATVNGSGLVSFIGVGTTTITASIVAGNIVKRTNSTTT